MKKPKHIFYTQKPFCKYYYEVYEDKVIYKWEELHIQNEGEVLFEQIGGQVKNLKKADYTFFLAGFGAFLIGLYLLFAVAKEDFLFFFVGLGAIIVGVFLCIWNTSTLGKFMQIYGSSQNISLFYNIDNESEAEEFVKCLIAERNAYLQKKFKIIESFLPLENKRAWAEYLYDQFVISKEEMDDALNRQHIYRNDPKIGFKIPKKDEGSTDK